jgi:hypothetical protein
MYVFEGICNESGLFFKNLFDMLMQLSPVSNGTNACIRQAFFKVDASGLQIYTSVNNSIWVSSQFEAKNFSSFNINLTEVNIGANLELVKNFFKNTKKQDHVIFKILAEECGAPTEMEISIVKKDHDMTVTNVINVQTVQSENLDYEGRLANPIQCKSTEFATMCRNINHINMVEISFSPTSAKFFFNVNDVSRTTIILGNHESNSKYDFTEQFNASYIKNVNKLSTFSQFLKMYAMPKQPLVLETLIGSIGMVRVWIKAN